MIHGNITFGEVLAGVFAISLLATVSALLILRDPIPDQIWSAFTVGVGYLLGSRTSQPHA